MIIRWPIFQWVTGRRQRTRMTMQDTRRIAAAGVQMAAFSTVATGHVIQAALATMTITFINSHTPQDVKTESHHFQAVVELHLLLLAKKSAKTGATVLVSTFSRPTGFVTHTKIGAHHQITTKTYVYLPDMFGLVALLVETVI